MFGSPSPARLRPLAALLAALLLGSCGGGPTDAPPVVVQVVSGDRQEGTVGAALSQPLAVRVTDRAGQPLVGRTVAFTVVQGGGVVAAGSAITDAEGVARDTWTLGVSAADSQAVEVRVADVPGRPAVIVRATARAGAPTQMVLAGAGQNGTVGRPLADSLLVRVVDRFGNGVPGVTVTFAVPSAGGTLSPSTDVTSATGHARSRWTLGGTPGSYAVTVTAGAFSATVGATALAVGVPYLSIASGNGQTGPVGSTLPQPLVVRAVDAAGAPAAGVPVRLEIWRNNGWVTGGTGFPPVVTTGADGTASVRWGLGGKAGANELRASASGYAPVTFTATGLRGEAAKVVKHAGDFQTWPVGLPLPVAPAVLVTDALNNPVPGVTVTFAVASGGGSVTGATALSDEAGVARVGSWVLGPTAGENTLTATAAGLTPALTFTATARTGSPDIKVTVVNPRPSESVYDSTLVLAQITSTYQLASVRASAAGQTVDLPRITGSSSWNWGGKLPLPQLPYGPLPIRVTATDVFGGVTEAEVVATYNEPAIITINSPVQGQVVRGGVLNYDIVCTDDDPAAKECEAMRLLGGQGSVQLAYSQNGVMRGSLSLGATPGATEFWIEGGRPFITRRTVYNEPSPQLRELVAGEGPLHDATGDRALYEVVYTTRVNGVRTNVKELRMRHAGTGRVEVLWSGSPTLSPVAALTPAGAIFTGVEQTSAGQPIYEWRDGQRTQVGSGSQLRVAGNYAVWVSSPGSQLIQRDLTAGTNVTIETLPVAGVSLDTTGAVAYTTTGLAVYVKRPGAAPVQVAQGSSGPLGPTYSSPRVLPSGVLYLREQRSSTSVPWRQEIVLNQDGVETALATLVQGQSYAVSDDGWIAFTKPDISGVPHAWRRSPDGVEEQISFLSGASLLDAIGPGGQMVFRVGNSRYFVPAGSTTAKAVGSTNGRVVWRDGRFVVILGNMALEILP